MTSKENKINKAKEAIADLEDAKRQQCIPYHDTCTEAIAALRKEIPLEPKVNLWDKWCECPICDGIVSFEETIYNYCPDCGQAIKWQEVQI